MFSTPAYDDARKKIREYARIPFCRDLYAVDGFLSLAEHKFGEAKTAFAQLLPAYSYKVPKYEGLMHALAERSALMRDRIAENGYRELEQFFRAAQQSSQ